MLRVGLVQMTSSDEPAANLAATRELIAEAAAGGARFVLTPEVTNCLSSDRAWQQQVLTWEEADPVLAGLAETARAHGIWLLIGSLALRVHDEPRLANRSLLISPEGGIVTRYDKIHMFDVNVSPTEVYRESAGYRPGDRAVTAALPFATLGLTICYDLRFPHLYRRLAKAGAEILTVPAAFNHITGAAHWEVLLRARAIETGCFVLAPAQCGTHPSRDGRGRRSHGHSLVVAPWGEVLADGGEAPGVVLADLDMAAVATARQRVPALGHDRGFSGP